MNRIIWVILLLGMLSLTVMNCGGKHSYNEQLVAADSMMHDFPDSALALVEGVCRDSLTAESDRAYRDLLFTQARYRCYITATSDSEINHALAYYRAHSKDREKLTRAYIYKGAVMDELGRPDSAMFYYKHAETTAAPDDFFNLGYVKMRMGSIYRTNYAMDGKPIELYEEALTLFTKCNDLDYQHKCLNIIGCLYREIDSLKAEQLLYRALRIADLRDDTVNHLEDLHALVVLYYYYENLDKALGLIHTAINLDASKMSFSFCSTAANVYAKKGLVDSSLIFLDLASQYDYKNNEKFRMYFLESEAEIKLAQGDTINYLRLNRQASRISDSLITNSSKPAITKAEHAFDKVSTEATHKRLSNAMAATIITSCLAMIIVAVGIIAYRSKSKQYRLIIEGLKKEKDKQLDNLDDLKKHFDSLQIKDKNIKQFIAMQLKMLRAITANCYHAPNSKLSREIKNIIAFQDENRHLWPLIYDYIDAEYNSIMSVTLEDYPDLNEKELLLLALSCMDFSYIQMSIILGYPNPTSVGTLKTRLSEKIGLSVNEYISSFSTTKTLD